MRKKYVYGASTWKDKLTSYNGTTITYDTIGNPLSDGTWTYTWQAGRQLKKMTKSGVTVEFKYDHNGLRTQKKVTQNGVITTTNYTLHGKLVTHMTVGVDTLHFFYDNQQRPAKVNFNGTVYTYLHNLQGDIVGIVDGNGTLVVEYNYDAWGKLLSTIGTKAATLGKLNPFRYRGYIYDEENGLYYLRSRYYNPAWSRFIDADTLLGHVGTLGSHNLFAYCRNMPVGNKDPNGRDMAFDPTDLLAGGAIISGGMLLTNLWMGENVDSAVSMSVVGRKNRAPMISPFAPETTEEGLLGALQSVKPINADMLKDHYSYNYYFAFCQNVNSLSLVFVVPLALNIEQAKMVLETTGIRNKLTKFLGINNAYGIYTATFDAAHALKDMVGAKEDTPHIGAKPGTYFNHFNDAGHAYHIWYGLPINTGGS